MNIGIVTTWFPSGAGYVSRAYKEALEKDHRIFIFARGGKRMKGDDFWDGDNVYWAKEHYKITGIWQQEFKRWINKNKLDAILFNEQRHWEPVILAKEMGITVAAYIDYYTQRTVPLFAIYDVLFCNTERHYSVFEWHKGAKYIPWGVNTEKFRPTYNLSRNLTFLVSLGVEGETDRRGGRLAIRAFLETKGNVKLIVCCQTPKESCSQEFHEEVGSDSRIEVRYGTFDMLPFSEAHVFIYPSRLEGIGLALPEAVSSGLACITTNSPPMNQFVQDSFNGYLIDVEKYLGTHHGYYWAESVCSVAHLTRIIQRYIDDPALVQEHQVNARQFAEKKLDWQINSEDLGVFFSSASTIQRVEKKNLIFNRVRELEKSEDIYSGLKKLFFFVKVTIRQFLNK